MLVIRETIDIDQTADGNYRDYCGCFMMLYCRVDYQRVTISGNETSHWTLRKHWSSLLGFFKISLIVSLLNDPMIVNVPREQSSSFLPGRRRRRPKPWRAS